MERQKFTVEQQAIIDACQRDLDRFAAMEQAVDAGLSQLTAVDSGLPKSQNSKSKPPIPANVTAAGDPRLRRLISVDPRLSKPQLRGTNPPLPALRHQSSPAVPPPALTPRQLAAARMIARGAKPADVAAALQITPQGLWKWRKLPAFSAECRRLHEILARPAGR
jgi:hypothetical protein